MRTSLSLFLLATSFFLTVAGAHAQSAPPSPEAAQSNSKDSSSNATQRSDALQTDQGRMRVLLEQMQENLGMVQNLNTPLRHQFELEIEMWQVLLQQMARDSGQAPAKP